MNAKLFRQKVIFFFEFLCHARIFGLPLPRPYFWIAFATPVFLYSVKFRKHTVETVDTVQCKV